MIVGSVRRAHGIRYGVLLAGETEAIAIQPVNLRPVYTARFAPPGHRDRAWERGGDGAAHVVVFSSVDVQTEGARYKSSEWRTVPEDKDYDSVACNIVLNHRTGMIMESSAGTKKKTTQKSNQLCWHPSPTRACWHPSPTRTCWHCKLGLVRSSPSECALAANGASRINRAIVGPARGRCLSASNTASE